MCCRRLPGCPDTCSKLLQAALQSHDEAAVQAQSPGTLQHPSADWADPGDAHMEEAEHAPMLQPSPEVQLVASPLMQLLWLCRTPGFLLAPVVPKKSQ